VDDHGNTRAAATPLVVIGGTNVASTTPETDPANLNPANKGVLERNTDVDVFSFVTGSGQISLTVNPWIMPAGTRGGNLDVLLELYDEAGTLVSANNATNRTYASLSLTLAEGLYFLQVRNSGTGDPLSATPSGYTSYASLGQYFISGTVKPSGYVVPPKAELQVTDLTQPGVGSKQFTVTYSDNMAMDVSTIDSSDLRVTGPNGYDRAAQFVSIDVSSDGTPRVATYAADPPGGGFWTHNDQGVYTISLRTNQVSDTEGSWVAGQQLGQFSVNVPLVLYSDNLDMDSGWTLQPQWQYGVPAYSGSGPASGFTGTKIIGYNLSGNYSNNLPSTYATSPVIDCSGASSLTLRFQRWLRLRNNDTALIEVSTNGSSWITVWSTSSSVQDSAWQAPQYPLPSSVAGSSTVRLRFGLASNGSQTDIGWNIDDVEIFGQSGNPPQQFLLATLANNPAWGSITPSGGTYPAGSTVDVTARPATYFQFKNWTGGASGSNNPITITMDANRTVQAVFEEISTTNHPTPLWWLASYGYTQNLETVVTTLGSNGVALWQSFIAGLNPNDPASQLRLSVAQNNSDSVVLRWNAVTGRVYTVWSSTNGVSTFAPISGAANLPSSITAITNGPINSSAMTFYRLEVWKP
jgi:predicted NUDIX family NTP pyrophosphohydrolase